MSNVWQAKDPDFRKQVIENISFKTGLSPNAIEKDWWVTMVLNALFQTGCKDSLVFKGGTSLSKGWGLIQRFSEDIDLAIDRTFFGFGGELNGSQRKLLQKAAKKYVCNDLALELNRELLKLGVVDFSIELEVTEDSRQDPVVIYVNYNSIFPESDYVPNRVKIEMNCRSLREPYAPIQMCSLIAENYPESNFADERFLVNTVLPTRTFLEKAFLLHEEFKKDNIRSVRMTRHLYDLVRLMDTDFGKDALDPELYVTVVKHRYAFTKIPGLDYSLHHPANIDFVPSETLLPAWKKDYEQMIMNFIYGEPPSFEELISKIKILRERFRQLTIEDDFFREERK